MENVFHFVIISDVMQDGDATMENVTQSKDTVHHQLNVKPLKSAIWTNVLTIVQSHHAQQALSAKETDVSAQVNVHTAHNVQVERYAEMEDVLIAAALSYAQQIQDVTMETVSQYKDTATKTANVIQGTNALTEDVTANVLELSAHLEPNAT